MATDRQSVSGGCHCGAVRFSIDLPQHLQVRACTCSICQMSGHLHLTVARKDFKLLTDESALTEYRFNTGAARHLFCRTCGIKSFYQPRSHPDAWSVNFRCVDLPDGFEVQMDTFDGANWEASIDGIGDILNR